MNGVLTAAMMFSSFGTSISVLAQEQPIETAYDESMNDSNLGFGNDAGEDYESTNDSPLGDPLETDSSNFFEGEGPADDTLPSSHDTSSNSEPSSKENEENVSNGQDEDIDIYADEEPEDKYSVYTLNLRHQLSFKVNGKTRIITTSETHYLDTNDFVNDEFDVKQLSSTDEHLMVTDADILTKDDFGQDAHGEATIQYAVNDSYRVEKSANYENGESIEGTVFEGVMPDDYTFVPANIIRLKVNYEYSSTGGLSGIQAFNSEIIEVQLEKSESETGKFQGSYSIANKVKDGFRLVLNPQPLNEYVVNPPQEGEVLSDEDLQKRLENGDFNVNVNDPSKPVYWYQQRNLSSDSLELNGTYKNKYSDGYNEAWDRARTRNETDSFGNEILSITAQDNPKEEHQGGNALKSPELKFELTQEKFDSLKDSASVLEITIYYRRNATWYTVNHWVPQGFAESTAEQKVYGAATYYLCESEEIQGRAGAITNAKAKIGGAYELLTALPISQQIIQNRTEDNETIVNIYYKTADSYRVIFDTNYAYIPRQQVPMNGVVNFPDENSEPKRKGYIFAGWQYIQKSDQLSEDGEFTEPVYKNVSTQDGKPYLEITKDFLESVELIESGDAVAIHLYPKWEVDMTQIRVVLWTENLNGTGDVQAKALGGDTRYYESIYKNFGNSVQTNFPTEENKAKYSNVGSFALNVQTGSVLVDGDNLSDSVSLYDTNKNELTDKTLSSEVLSQFASVMGKDSEVSISDFYTQAAVEVVHEGESQSTEDPKSASADGHTMVYVYFTRNIYELLFTYYGAATPNVRNDTTYSAFCIAANTTGYSKSTSTSSSAVNNNGYLKFSSQYNNENRWMSMTQASQSDPNVPKTITIRAKYGADLREVWPVARADQTVTTKGNDGDRGTTSRVISWAPLAGKYRDKAVAKDSETTIHGSYAAMSAEIIADPKRPVTNPDAEIKELTADDKNPAGGFKNNLVAYWFNGSIDYYRYNHCVEIPVENADLTVVEGAQKIKISTDWSNQNPFKDYIYLIPINNSAFTTYGFEDLLPVKLANINSQPVIVSTDNQVIYGADTNTSIQDPAVNESIYYAIRQYTNSGSTKYYALTRQVSTVSSNIISAQNPSIRDHMKRVNSIADHSQDHQDDHGLWNGSQNQLCGSVNNPYDLFFYYNRDRYKITYMVPCNNEDSEKSEIELGSIVLPYGAKVIKRQHAFLFNYTDRVTENWPEDQSLNGNISVCPDRAQDGTSAWEFKGWSLGTAGQNMLWTKKNASISSEQDAFDGEEFAIEGNLRIYAIWQRPSYTVIFDLAGGEVGKDVATVVSVPANTKFTSNSNGSIPRPLRDGYTFVGWYEEKYFDESGKLKADAEQFDFESKIADNKRLKALWKLSTNDKFYYSVYYVTPVTLIDEKTIWINGNDIKGYQIEGYTPYRLLECEEPQAEAYSEGMTLSLSPKKLEGYIPRDTSQSVGSVQTDGSVVIEKNENYNVIFIYNPISSPYIINVHYVLAGTENKPEPTEVIESVEYQSDNVYPTPGIAQSAALITLGYHFVNRTEEGNYIPINSQDGKGIGWIDKDGEVRTYDGNRLESIADYADENGEVSITFLVAPTVFEISYQVGSFDSLGLDNQTKEKLVELAQKALTFVIPQDKEEILAENRTTYINPNRYKTTDGTFTLTNPPHLYDSENDKWYRFAGWTRGESTNVKPGSGEQPENAPANPLSIATGSVGNLTFLANWEEETELVDLTISKIVNGNFGNRNLDFDFSFSISELLGETSQSTYPQLSENFKLKHGGKKTIKIPKGLVYEVKESQLSDYDQSYQIILGTSSSERPITEDKITDVKNFGPSSQKINENTEVVFNNKKDIDKPVTGIDGQNPAWILGLAAGVSLLALLFWMKKYRYEKE